MAVIYECDGCGKQERMKRSFKPHEWFQREDEDGEQHACSRLCIGTTAAKTSKTSVVLPL